jgi:hypothetical protein
LSPTHTSEVNYEFYPRGAACRFIILCKDGAVKFLPEVLTFAMKIPALCLTIRPTLRVSGAVTNEREVVCAFGREILIRSAPPGTERALTLLFFPRARPKWNLCLFDSADSDTQQGNNNTYCQDSELTWLDWQLTDEEREFIEFVREVIAIRREQPVFQRRKFFQGRAIFGADVPDINWFEPSGKPMGEEGWNAGYNQCFGFALAGDLIGDVDERGQPIVVIPF